MTALDLITKDDLELFKTQLFAELQKLLPKQQAEKQQKLLRSKDVRKLLNISSGTLQTLRINGTLPYSKIGSIPYYKLDDINKILSANQSKKR
ncbi:helix-turn-helix domain-containing protein [Pedobacter sp. Du54]|uniref:helix-turn-helix domain-containing protein n=1 Tax=Pedobacter anseongensis TaxID=3133439 RepID=UPI0030AB9964